MSKNTAIVGPLVILALIIVAAIYGDAFVGKPMTTYSNEQYGFSIQYPSNLTLDETEGSTDYSKSFLSLDIGSREYIAKLKKVNSSDGGEGMTLFLRITADIPRVLFDADNLCQNGQRGTVLIDGISAVKCEALLFDAFPTIGLFFNLNGVEFAIQSDSYSDSDKILIDRIISTFRFLR